MAKRSTKSIKSVVETPVVETPVVETPVVETPTVEETATAIAEVENPKKQRAARTSNVPKSVLIAAVVAGKIANKTNVQVAEELGMKIKSFDSRLSTVRKECKNPKGKQKPFDVPYLRTELGGVKGKSEISDDFIEKMRAMLAKAESQNETPDAETTAETAASE